MGVCVHVRVCLWHGVCVCVRVCHARACVRHDVTVYVPSFFVGLFVLGLSPFDLL